MQNSLWKLTALAGVIGLGFLVVLQAQRGLAVPGLQDEAAVSAEEGSAQAALDAGEEAPLADLGAPSQLTQIAPDQNQPAVLPEDPFSGGPAPLPQPTAARSGATERRLPSPAMTDAAPFDFDQPSEPQQSAATSPRVAETAAPTRVPVNHADPFEMEQPALASREPGLREPALRETASREPASRGEAVPVAGADPFGEEPATVNAMHDRVDAANAVQLTSEEAPATFEADLQPVPTRSGQRTPGPDLRTPAELDSPDAAEARPLRTSTPPRAGMRRAPSRGGQELAQANGSLPPSYDPFDTSEEQTPPRYGEDTTAPSFDSDATRSRVGRAGAEPRVPSVPRDNDPFGPFMVRDEADAPSVANEEAAFPETDSEQPTAPRFPESSDNDNATRGGEAFPADEAFPGPTAPRSEPRADQERYGSDFSRDDMRYSRDPLDSRDTRAGQDPDEPRYSPDSRYERERGDAPDSRYEPEQGYAPDSRYSRDPLDSRAPLDSPDLRREPSLTDDNLPTRGGDDRSADPDSIRLYDRETYTDSPPRVPRDRDREDWPRYDETPARALPPANPAPNDQTAPAMRGTAVVESNAPRGPQRPQLKIEKLAPPNAVLGQKLVYDILVKNIGQTTAYDVTVEDRVPKGTQLEGTNPQAEMLSQSKKLVWRLGELGPGQERKISVCVIPTEEGQIGSVATVNFVAEVAAETVITAPKLEFELIGPPQAAVGSQVSYTFKVRNTGSGDATNVWIRNLIPQQLKHGDGNDLEYEVGRLPAGKSREVSLTLVAAEAGDIRNKAVVTADGGVSVESIAPLSIQGEQIAVTRTGPTQRYIGRPGVYVNTVRNNGSQPVAGTIIIENVPEGMEFAEATEGGKYDPDRRAVTWRADRLAPGESRELKVTLVARELGAHESLVTVAGANGGRAQVTSTTDIEGFAALGLDMPAVESPITVGEQVALRIAARNRGNMDATNVQVAVTVPPGMNVVSVRGPKYAQNGSQIVFEVMPAVGGNRQADIDVILKAHEPGNARVAVEVSSDQLQEPLSREEIIYVLPPSR